MTRPAALRFAFILSVSINLAALGIVGWHALQGTPGPDSITPTPPSLSALNLSPAQETAFQRLRSEFRAFRHGCHKHMVSLRETLLDEVLADEPNRAKIDGLIDQMSTRQADLQRHFVKHVLDERAILTADQRPAFERMLRRHALASPPGFPAGPGCRPSDAPRHPAPLPGKANNP